MQPVNKPWLYQSTVTVVSYNFKGIKPGQWVRLAENLNQRGQYMGRTNAGTEVIRWQQSDAPSFAKRDAKANRPVRSYAKQYGAK